MRQMPIVRHRSRGSAPQRRIFLLARTCAGFSLLELLIVIAIIGVTCCLAIPTLSKFIYQQNAGMTLQQIDLAMALARSNTFAHNTPTSLCPSHNGYSCSTDWSQGILVTAANLTPQFFKVQRSGNGILYLTQSGHTTYLLTVNPDGYATSNGHFCYRALNSEWPEFKLYFNRALRTYFVIN